MENSEKERIKKAAKSYALTLVDEHDGTPQFICYCAGAEDERRIADWEIYKLNEQLALKDARIKELEERIIQFVTK